MNIVIVNNFLQNHTIPNTDKNIYKIQKMIITNICKCYLILQICTSRINKTKNNRTFHF